MTLLSSIAATRRKQLNRVAWKGHFDCFCRLTLLVTGCYYLNPVPSQCTQLFADIKDQVLRGFTAAARKCIPPPAVSYTEGKGRWKEAHLFICCLYVCLCVFVPEGVWVGVSLCGWRWREQQQMRVWSSLQTHSRGYKVLIVCVCVCVCCCLGDITVTLV